MNVLKELLRRLALLKKDWPLNKDESIINVVKELSFSKLIFFQQAEEVKLDT